MSKKSAKKKNSTPKENLPRVPLHQRRWFKPTAIVCGCVLFLAAVAWGIVIGLRPTPPDPIRQNLYVYGDYEYEILEDDTISILTYIGDEENLSIPISNPSQSPPCRSLRREA